MDITFCALPISLFGLTAMSSFLAGDSYLFKQSIWIFLGCIVYFVISKMDMSFGQEIQKLSYFLCSD